MIESEVYDALATVRTRFKISDPPYKNRELEVKSVETFEDGLRILLVEHIKDTYNAGLICLPEPALIHYAETSGIEVTLDPFDLL